MPDPEGRSNRSDIHIFNPVRELTCSRIKSF